MTFEELRIFFSICRFQKRHPSDRIQPRGQSADCGENLRQTPHEHGQAARQRGGITGRGSCLYVGGRFFSNASHFNSNLKKRAMLSCTVLQASSFEKARGENNCSPRFFLHTQLGMNSIHSQRMKLVRPYFRFTLLFFRQMERCMTFPSLQTCV